MNTYPIKNSETLASTMTQVITRNASYGHTTIRTMAFPCHKQHRDNLALSLLLARVHEVIHGTGITYHGHWIMVCSLQGHFPLESVQPQEVNELSRALKHPLPYGKQQFADSLAEGKTLASENNTTG